MGRGAAALTVAGLAIAGALALLSPLASGDPDGLERVAEEQGFLERAQDPAYTILPDYSIPGLSGPLSTIVAGVVGLLIVFALVYGVTLLLRGRQEQAAAAPPSRPSRG
jgi:cobalt/nickel transport system permease protein